MKDREVGVGLVSVGWMGILHSRSYANFPKFYPELGIKPKLIIAADTTLERQEYAKDVLGYAQATSDYMDVINHPEVQVVSVCSPNYLHREIGIAVARAGKALWIEKPVGRSGVETAELEAEVVKAGIVTSIGFNYRCTPAIQYAREIIAAGDLGEITHFRGSFFADYSAEANSALSWRFKKEFAGSGVLGDLMGHLVDLIHYTVGPISEANGFTKTVYKDRPILPMGSATHFAVIEGGERGAVENEDYAGALVKIGESGIGAGAIGTIEASRISVGPRSAYNIEIYGTKGSLKWDFERMNELELSLGRNGANVGYQRIMANSYFGDFSKFQPGSGTSMGYDDLKVIELKRFMQAYFGEASENSNIHDATSAGRVCDAIEQSQASGSWTKVPATKGTTAALKAKK
jgi:predicted dehydrogenase